MTGRHTRKPVWLTRLRAPFATTSARTLPEFDLDLNPLSAEHVGAWRNRVAGGLWLKVVDGPLPLGTARRTEEESLEHLAPRVKVAKATSPVRILLQRVRGSMKTAEERKEAKDAARLRGYQLSMSEMHSLALILVVLSGLAGYGIHAMTIEAPQDCAKALTLADGIVEDQENYTDAVIMMKSRGQSEYEGHEADAIQLWDDIDAAKADYRDAKAACLGGAS